MRFITMGYGDEDGYQATDPAVRERAHRQDDELAARGALAAIAGSPVQVRNPDGSGLTVTPGAFLRSDLPVAGFGLIEADSLDEAVRMVAGTPCAVAQGVVEVWPLQE